MSSKAGSLPLFPVLKSCMSQTGVFPDPGPPAAERQLTCEICAPQETGKPLLRYPLRLGSHHHRMVTQQELTEHRCGRNVTNQVEAFRMGGFV